MVSLATGACSRRAAKLAAAAVSIASFYKETIVRAAISKYLLIILGIFILSVMNFLDIARICWYHSGVTYHVLKQREGDSWLNATPVRSSDRQQ
jgi:hypothetical protein